ncbi:MAG TPA: acetyl-CoA carboxylase carboxyl transferase subunit alpha, partial [Verrucomicrobiales bacterium]|nr:acetyl-CoA carboxylase carboxyl transferase subunit alpha [Verrucomicrobiales bacterium]
MKYYLEFEKPVAELQRKLDELKRHEESSGLAISFQDEISQIERKIQETRQQIFSNLNAHQRVQLARHPKRPYTLDYIQ